MPEEHKRRPSIGGSSSFLPIKVLSTYTTRWKIKARVVDKTPITTFQKRQGGGQGSIFNTVLMDAEGSQIGCKFWNEAAEKFYPQLEKGKVYSFGRGRVSVANKRYSGTIDHNYEITFDNPNEAEVLPLEGTESEIPIERQLQYSSLRSLELSTKTLPFMANILVVPHAWQPLREVNIKGEQRKVRNVTMVDATKFALDVAFWGDDAEAIDELALQDHHVVSMGNLQIREGRGRVATVTRGTEVKWKVGSKEAEDLKNWYVENSGSAVFKSLSADLATAGSGQAEPVEATVAEVLKKINDGFTEESLSFKVTAYISSVLYRNPRSENAINLVYQACSKCNRKVNEGGPSVHCEKCNASVPSAPRITTTVTLSDASAGGLLVRVFSDTAQLLSGHSAQSLATMCEQDETGVVQLCEYELPFKRYVFILRARMDTYRDESRINISVSAAAPFTPMAAASQSIAAILKIVPNIFDCPPATKRVCLDRKEEDEPPAMDKRQRLDGDSKENVDKENRGDMGRSDAGIAEKAADGAAMNENSPQDNEVQ